LLPATPDYFRENVLRMRQLIRTHRDEVGHDRCHISDLELWAAAADLVTSVTINLHPHQLELLDRCTRFRACRVCPNEPTLTQSAPGSNDDLLSMTNADLEAEFFRLQAGIAAHYQAFNGHRKIANSYVGDWQDDLKLYLLLPERRGANTTLPPRHEHIANCAEFCSNDPLKDVRSLLRNVLP
jgi:hypothetical protein